MRKLFRRLFFYSSRQLYRRRRSYISIFVTSVVLLTLVMAFFETLESYMIGQMNSEKCGMYHASIRAMSNDLTKELTEYPTVREAYAIPYTSMMASSDDASSPARITVYSKETADRLNVRFLWGGAPSDGEIAVSTELYNAYSYLIAGEENEMYFKAAEMTYYPLRISGIFDTSDGNAGYAFVTEATAASIDRETGAKTKYDIYIRFKNNSDRYIAAEFNKIMTELRIPDTQFQSRKEASVDKVTKWFKYRKIYVDYLNSGYVRHLLTQKAFPTLAISMPVIVIAAIMLASFTSNWMASNSAEYGILGAIGANRRQLCAISAGQVMLITLLAALPVIGLSAAVSNVYIGMHNRAFEGRMEMVFTIPWLSLVEVSLWFALLSCFFTYIGIAKLTLEPPFALISGSFRANMPFVKKTSSYIIGSRNKVKAVALVTAVREIRSSVVFAIMMTLVSVMCGVFVITLIMFNSITTMKLGTSVKYNSDAKISLKQTVYYDRKDNINEKVISDIKTIDGIKYCGGYTFISERNGVCATTAENGWASYARLFITDSGKSVNGLYADKEIMHLVCQYASEEQTEMLRDGYVILIEQNDTESRYGRNWTVGEKISIGTGSKNSKEFEVAAVIPSNNGTGDVRELNFTSDITAVMTAADAAFLGVGIEGEYTTALCEFDEGLSDEEKNRIADELNGMPLVMRYNIQCFSALTKSEKLIKSANYTMFSIFFGTLYFAFCTMTYTDANLKFTKKKRDISVMRQLGASDSDVRKTVVYETLPSSLLAAGITAALFIVVICWYGSYSFSQLNIMADRFPLTYTPAVYAEHKSEIWTLLGIMAVTYIPTLLLEAVTAGVRMIGAVIPLEKYLREPIVEGIRRDTD